MFWFVAEEPAGVVDGEERLATLDRAAQRDVREDLGHQVGARPGHDGFGGGDDSHLGAVDRSLKR